MSTVFNHPEFGGHERIQFFSNDRKGWKAAIAIHNTALGPAMGGCRMYPYADAPAMIADVLRLSAGMTYKAAAAGLSWGGGKMVVWADPQKDKTPGLLAWIGQCVEHMGGYYTGEDMGIKPVDVDIIRQHTKFALGGSSGSGDPSLMTARGVRLGILKCIKFRYPSLSCSEIVIAVQGVGAVGAPLVELLHADGFSLIVADTDPAKVAAIVARYPMIRAVDWHDIHKAEAHVFAPCAIGGILNAATIPEIRARIVCGSANTQLAVPMDGLRLYARGILYAPDFVVNAGGLCNIVGETDPAGYSEARVWPYIYRISDTLQRVFEEAAKQPHRTPEVVALAMAKERIDVARALG